MVLLISTSGNQCMHHVRGLEALSYTVLASLAISMVMIHSACAIQFGHVNVQVITCGSLLVNIRCWMPNA